MSLIKVVAADTRLCPVDLGSYSSRVTFMAGNAARNAAIRMRRSLVKLRLQNFKHLPPHKRRKIRNLILDKNGLPIFKWFLGLIPITQYLSFQRSRVYCTTGQKLKYLDVLNRGSGRSRSLQSTGSYMAPQNGGILRGGSGPQPSL